MLFAISYLIFFLVDIMAECRFLLFGMAPYHALVAAVGLYTLVMMRTLRFHTAKTDQKHMVTFWMGFMAAMSVQHLFFSSLLTFYMKMLGPDLVFRIMDTSNIVFFIGSVLLLLLTWVYLKGIRIYGWLLFSAGAMSLPFLIYLLWNPLPTLLYRYEGVMGLPMLFGWLMISIRSIQMKFDQDFVPETA